MSIAYGILCVISLALIGVCLAVDRKKIYVCCFCLYRCSCVTWDSF